MNSVAGSKKNSEENQDMAVETVDFKTTPTHHPAGGRNSLHKTSRGDH